MHLEGKVQIDIKMDFIGAEISEKQVCESYEQNAIEIELHVCLFEGAIQETHIGNSLRYLVSLAVPSHLSYILK